MRRRQILSAIALTLPALYARATTRAALVDVSVEILENGRSSLARTVTIRSGDSHPIDERGDIPYVAAAKKDADGNVLKTTKNMQIGLAVRLSPAVLSDNRISVGLSVDRSHLVAMRKFANGDVGVDLPEIQTLHVEQTVVVADGQSITLPLSGLTDDGAANTEARISARVVR